MTVEAGRQIAHYEIQREIGRGEMGVVYLVGEVMKLSGGQADAKVVRERLVQRLR